jgi:hypothetical protein
MFCAAFESFRMRNKDFRICGEELSTFFPPAGTVIEVAGLQTLHALERVTSVMTRRKLITTAKGFLGVALKSAARGDVICILLGCEFPVVLRPLAYQDSFELVGVLYQRLDGKQSHEMAGGWPVSTSEYQNLLNL